VTSKRKETIGRELDQRGEQTRTKLLEAAIECFATQGYDATGTRQIESKAGVKRGLIAWHFQSKEILWKAAAVSLFSRAAEDFAAVRMQLSDVSQTQQLRQMVKVYVRFLAKYPQIHRLLSTEGSHESWRRIGNSSSPAPLRTIPCFSKSQAQLCVRLNSHIISWP